MRHSYSLLLAATLLVSCSTETTTSRYKDISALEQPPTLPSDPTYRPDTSYGMDEGRIDKRRTGLADNVYLVEGKPLQMRIKQRLDKAWYVLVQALKQNKDSIKLTDHDRAKGTVFVTYGEESSGFLGFGGSTPNNYMIALKEYGNETVLIATLSGEKNSSDDDSDKLVRQLYETLHDNVRPD